MDSKEQREQVVNSLHTGRQKGVRGAGMFQARGVLGHLRRLSTPRGWAEALSPATVSKTKGRIGGLYEADPPATTQQTQAAAEPGRRCKPTSNPQSGADGARPGAGRARAIRCRTLRS